MVEYLGVFGVISRLGAGLGVSELPAIALLE